LSDFTVKSSGGHRRAACKKSKKAAYSRTKNESGSFSEQNAFGLDRQADYISYSSLDVVIVLNIRLYKKRLMNVRSFVRYAYDKLRIVWVEKTQPKLQPYYI
jgi:hypothetical protein